MVNIEADIKAFRDALQGSRPKRYRNLKGFLAEHWDELADVITQPGRGRVDWRGAADYLNETGVKLKGDKPVTGQSLYQATQQLKKDIDEGRFVPAHSGSASSSNGGTGLHINDDRVHTIRARQQDTDEDDAPYVEPLDQPVQGFSQRYVTQR